MVKTYKHYIKSVCKAVNDSGAYKNKLTEKQVGRLLGYVNKNMTAVIKRSNVDIIIPGGFVLCVIKKKKASPWYLKTNN